MIQSQRSQTSRSLGYPDDARLLIINADDFGRAHACNAGTLRALIEGVVSSTTLMAPCPWALHAMHLLADQLRISFGVHRHVVNDGPLYGCGAFNSRNKVKFLVDEMGFF